MICECLSYMKQLKVICTLVLAVSLFLAQGLQIHSHVYADVPTQSDHVHQSTVHFDHVVEQGEVHPDEPDQIKLAEESVLKNSSFIALPGGLCGAVVVYPCSLLKALRYVTFLFRSASSFDLGLSPPLRAPPL